jgi:hypothetical protein
MTQLMKPTRSESEDVDHLLLNARLRDELEPFLDDSVSLVNSREMPTPVENEYLASMLAWERAPVLPIADWFQPRLTLPNPDGLTADQLSELLWDAIHKLYEKRIVLDFTDHLSDYELFMTIARDILPSPEKRIETSPTYLHWQCLDPADDPEVWLRYYASEEERQAWAEETHEELPPAMSPPFRRRTPR